MIETIIEWYTKDEKLPFDGDLVTDGRYEELLCAISIVKGMNTVERLRYSEGKFIFYLGGEEIDCTEEVKYWAYVPEIKE